MAKKRKSLESKLGSWTDQASFTRTAPQPTIPTPEAKAEAEAEVQAKAKVKTEAKSETERKTTSTNRQRYQVTSSLITRINSTAKKHQMSQSELVGYLLTWALEQVETGAHEIAPNKPES